MQVHWRPQCLGYFANPFWGGWYFEHYWIDRQSKGLQSHQSFSTADYGFTFSYARKLPVPGFQYGVNAKIIRRIIGNLPILGGWIWCRTSVWKEWLAIQLMVRDITTTYNVWNIDEKNIKNCRCRTRTKSRTSWKHWITAPKAQLGLSKSSLSLWLQYYGAANVNMRFTKLTIYYLLILCADPFRVWIWIY
jgi:hypothetical protein